MDATNYSGLGSWNTAADLSSPDGSWYDEASVEDAIWISTADPREGNNDDNQWRLFKDEFNVPCNVIIDSADLYMTADNSVEAYLNGTSVGSADDAVFGPAPGPPWTPGPTNDFHFQML